MWEARSLRASFFYYREDGKVFSRKGAKKQPIQLTAETRRRRVFLRVSASLR